MSSTGIPGGSDPRNPLGESVMLDNSPVVGTAARGASTVAIAAVFVALAVALFLFLNSHRSEETSLVTPASASASQPSVPPLDVPSPAPAPPPAQVVLPEPPAPVLQTRPVSAVPAIDPMQRHRAPAVIVDVQAANVPALAQLAAPANVAGGNSPAAEASADHASAIVTASDSASGVPPTASAGPGTTPLLGSNEQFAVRTSRARPDVSVATPSPNQRTTIMQGTLIPAVLETALNSDLPGFARAVVSRDVPSFNGKAVLIPRGSWLIGQYHSALALGQSRVFVIWTRVIRPDGVSVLIGSPGGDTLGRGGLSGDVDSHFFARFGGSILLSVLDAGLSAVASTPSTQITIGSPAQAVGAAASATVSQGSDIAPTVTVPQGAAITIFVARDLDFSAVRSIQ